MKKPQCIIPWTYLELLPSGVVSPCCSNPIFLGNIKEQSIDEIWNSDNMKKLRLEMLKDSLPEECWVCRFEEGHGKKSLREKYNEVLSSCFDSVEEETNPDGSVKEVKIKAWDFRISNKCNFKCRICSPTFSSSINNNVVVSCSEDLNIPKFLDEHIDHLQFMEFAGGETLLMDEHYDVLDRLISEGKTDIDIWYNTNMSILNYKGKSVLDYWRKFNPDKLKVTASIDEIDERAEYIRKGTVWKTVQKNLITLSKEKFNVNTNIVVSSYNVFRLPKIIDRLIEIGWISERYNYSNFELTLETSLHNVLAVLPKSYRLEISKQLETYIEEYRLKYGVDISKLFAHVISDLNMSVKNNAYESKEFLDYNFFEDDKRGERLFDVIPELKCISKKHMNEKMGIEY